MRGDTHACTHTHTHTPPDRVDSFLSCPDTTPRAQLCARTYTHHMSHVMSHVTKDKCYTARHALCIMSYITCHSSHTTRTPLTSHTTSHIMHHIIHHLSLFTHHSLTHHSLHTPLAHHSLHTPRHALCIISYITCHSSHTTHSHTTHFTHHSLAHHSLHTPLTRTPLTLHTTHSHTTHFTHHSLAHKVCHRSC